MHTLTEHKNTVTILWFSLMKKEWEVEEDCDLEKEEDCDLL